MPSIPIEFEIEHRNVNPITVPAGTTLPIDIPCPVGFKALSFGWSGQNGTLIIQTATIQPPANVGDVQRFVATVRNSAAADQTIRFNFVLVAE